MVPIYLHGKNERLSLHSFRERMIEICNEHRREKRALAFAFILYDFENPQVLKILRDSEYWDALNEISGKYLTIFSLNCRKQQRPRPIEHAAVSIGTQFLTEVSTNIGLHGGTYSLINKYFGRVQIDYPAILFFQVDQGSIIDSLLVDLKEEQIEPAFLELKDYVSEAVRALKLITPENRHNFREVFDCLERPVRSRRNVRMVKRAVAKAGDIAGLISLLNGLFPR